jgi:hypothetical protein
VLLAGQHVRTVERRTDLRGDRRRLVRAVAREQRGGMVDPCPGDLVGGHGVVGPPEAGDEVGVDPDRVLVVTESIEADALVERRQGDLVSLVGVVEVRGCVGRQRVRLRGGVEIPELGQEHRVLEARCEQRLAQHRIREVHALQVLEQGADLPHGLLELPTLVELHHGVGTGTCLLRHHRITTAGAPPHPRGRRAGRRAPAPTG